MSRVFTRSAIIAAFLLLVLPSLGRSDPCMPETTRLAIDTWTASAQCCDGGGGGNSWEVEETFKNRLGQDVQLRTGSHTWRRTHIELRRGWPTGPDGTPVRQNTIDTLANPTSHVVDGTTEVCTAPRVDGCCSADVRSRHYHEPSVSLSGEAARWNSDVAITLGILGRPWSAAAFRTSTYLTFVPGAEGKVVDVAADGLMVIAWRDAATMVHESAEHLVRVPSV